MLARIGALMLVGALACCRSEPQGEVQASPMDMAAVVDGVDTVGGSVVAAKPWSDAWLLGETQRYLHDATFRRQVLEASLTNPSNIYSRTRLSGYGLETAGWDMLPEWNPRTQIIDESYVQALQGGEPVYIRDDAEPMWDGHEPSNMSEWIALGRRMFYEYPLRGEVFAEHALRSTELATRVGLWADKQGHRPGVIAFASFDGGAEIGITCALCHVTKEAGALVEGRARREFDYGEMRLAFYRDTGAFLDEDLKRRMATWGPGRADITQDDDEDPVAIVDLWGVRDRDYLTQSGTLKQPHPAALAIRQETQFLQANQERVRPPRVLTWALAMYVYSLVPPARESQVANSKVLLGQSLFAKNCASCHRDRSYSGKPVSASVVGTDAALASGLARGTGRYRPAPLVGVADAGPYLHDGSVTTLKELFDPRRTVAGHRYGVDLALADRLALIAYLETL